MIDRPNALQGKTYKIKPPVIDAAIYITINDAEIDGQVRPVEIFINSKHLPSISLITIISRLLSAAFRREGPFPVNVVEELKQTFDAEGGYIIPKTKLERANSIVAHIGIVLEKHCKALGVIK